MRLLTHNMLVSNVKGVDSVYPLNIEVEEMQEEEVDFNAGLWLAFLSIKSASLSLRFVDFILATIPKLDWRGFQHGALALGIEELPENPSEELNEEALRKIHHALLEVHVVTGYLVCPSSGRKFPIQNGIPNMLLHPDELPEVKESEKEDD